MDIYDVIFFWGGHMLIYMSNPQLYLCKIPPKILGLYSGVYSIFILSQSADQWKIAGLGSVLVWWLSFYKGFIKNWKKGIFLLSLAFSHSLLFSPVSFFVFPHALLFSPVFSHLLGTAKEIDFKSPMAVLLLLETIDTENSLVRFCKLPK